MDTCKLKIVIVHTSVDHQQTLLCETLLTLLITILVAVTLFVCVASLRTAWRTLRVKMKRTLSLPLCYPVSEQSGEKGLLVFVTDSGRSKSQMFSRATLVSGYHHENSTLKREAVRPVQQMSTDKGELVASTG